MNGIKKELIDEVRERTDIVSLVSEYLPLKKVGKYYRTLCPFHKETSPSFYVSPERQIFHCFGCLKSGNAFTFLMDFEKMSFPESVKFLANRVGVHISSFQKEKGKYNELFAVNDFACKYYNGILKKNPKVMDRLKARGITPELIEKLQLGYAPDGWDTLLNAGQKNSFSVKLLEEAGLIISSKNSVYDRFRGRIIFPIFDLSKRVIGFGGRSLGNATPKYLNSPETPIYKKGKTLYGLAFTKSEIRKRNAAIIVEGYTDFISLYANGIDYCVATCGTALTPNQANLISRYVSTIFLSFDSDAAGMEATNRSIDILLEANVDVKVINLPEGDDPDSFVRKEGKDAYEKRTRESKNFIDFKIGSKKIEEMDVPSKTKLIKAICSSLSKITDELKQDLWIKEVAKNFGVTEKTIRSKITKNHSAIIRVKSPTKEGIPKVEISLFVLAFKKPKILEKVKTSLVVEDFSSAPTQQIAKILFDKKDFKVADAMSFLKDDRAKRLLSEAVFEETEVEDSDVVEDYILKIRKMSVERRLKELKNEIERKDSEGVVDYELLREYDQLSHIKLEGG